MNASELFLKCLEQEGVPYIFGVPGEENQDFLFALEKSSIGFIPTRHEQGAAFMANVHGRLTGRAGVCLSTLGPGATNLLTGVADANLDKAPLVAITGQGATSRMHHESHQMIDVVDMFEKVTKYSNSIAREAVIPEVVRAAFKIAEMEKPGATHIELPEDIAHAAVQEDVTIVEKKPLPRAVANQDSIDKAIELIRGSSKPLVLVGNGGIRARASQALCKLVTEKGIPVATTFMGKGAVAASDEHHVGTVGLNFKDYIIEAFELSDLIIAIGYDIAEYDPKHWNIGAEKSIIHIDVETAVVYQEYVPEVELVGDISNTLCLLNEQFDHQFETTWYSGIRQRISDSIAFYEQSDEATEFHTPGVIAAIREVLPEDGLLISDVGSHKMWIARNFECMHPTGCIISNGLASMGIALPGGIAAALIDPRRAIVCLMGDGGAMMNIQEIETAKRLGVAFVIVVVNDNNYGLIKWKQQMDEGKDFGTALGNPDFALLAESFGIEGYRPTTVKDFKKILKKCLGDRHLALIEMPVSTHVNDDLIQELKAYF